MDRFYVHQAGLCLSQEAVGRRKKVEGLVRRRKFCREDAIELYDMNVGFITMFPTVVPIWSEATQLPTAPTYSFQQPS
jgi:hypothetical protein